MTAFFDTVRLVLRWTVIPAYLAAFFLGWLSGSPGELALHGGLVLLAFWAFARTRARAGAWLLAAVFVAFYLLLYWSEAFTPLAVALGLKTKWVLYGLLYTLAVTGWGLAFLRRHRGDRYQVRRTWTLMLVQLALAFLLPVILPLLSQPEYYVSYLWPLKIEYFYPDVLAGFPLAFVAWSLAAALVLAPLFALLVGKRFYCSWVCGCGGLAETLGDRWRTLSDKSRAAWRFEQVSIHIVLGLALAVTAAIVLDWWLGRQGGSPGWLAWFAGRAREFYGFAVGATLSGLVGVAAYPILGPRVWCRYFCPMAAVLGLTQKAGRFQVRVKPQMCISCGNCSACCEMGIDVRDYARRDESFTRASCVGCGMCASVCPRGVLRLGNDRRSGRA